MEQNDQSSGVPLPIGLAALAGCVCFAFIYWAIRPLLILVPVWWAQLLIYSLLPLLVTFAILYRSGWHREMARMGRAGSLILVSGLSLCSDLVIIGIMVAVACMFLGINRGNQ
jgi:hypothetical protein